MKKTARKKKLMWIATLVSGLLLCQPTSVCAREVKTDVHETDWSWDKERTVTLNLKRATVKQFFDAVHQQTGLDFVYNTKQMAAMEPISISVKNEPIEKLLNLVFGKKGFTFKRNGNMVTVGLETQSQKTPVPSGARLQKQKVTGRIYDQQGEPLVGASVRIKGTNIGSVADINGVYEIEAEPNAVLQFSYIGMEAQEITYKGGNKLDVSLKADNKTELEAVVVTGIFQKPKESFTGAVSTITSEQLKMYKGQNMLQTLRNVDASINLAVDNISGSNPNNLPNINIRGTSSLPMSVKEFNEGVKGEVNTPLIIMDGFEISLTKLMDYNDNDIESINILKDASATALYGSRGANGVIVIVSKRPVSGRLKVTGTIGLNLEMPDLTSYDLLHAADKLELERLTGLYVLEGYPTTTIERQEIYNGRLRKVLSGVDTDWLSKPLRTGVGQRYNLRMEGGNEEFRWSTSADYNDTQGAMKGSSRKVFNGSITLMYSIKNLIFKNQTNIGITNSRESNYGSFSNYANQQPYNAPYDENGNIVRYFDDFYANPNSRTQNPLYDATLNSFDKSKYQDISNNFSIEWNIFDGLKLRGQLGISGQTHSSDYFLPAEHSKFNTDEYKSASGYFRRGLYRYGTGENQNYDGALTLSYTKIIADKHQLYTGLDYSITEYKSHSYGFEAEGFSNENMNYINNALQYEKDATPSGSKSTNRRIGLTANVNYTYDNRYFLDLSLRMDGSSNYGTDKKYAPFWSTGIGWNLHHESFLKENDVLTQLRLKASYGETGSMNFSSLATETSYKYVTNNKYLNWTGAYLVGLGNPDLTWQKTAQYNVGFEVGLWNGRFSGTFDYYVKQTNNLLSSMNIPLSMGFSSYAANVGEVKNNGFEIGLNGIILRNPAHHFSWSGRAQLVYNKNRIVKVSEAIKAQNEEYLKQNVDVSSLFYEGRPQNGIYAVRSLGIDPSSGKEIFLDKNGKITSTWNPSDKVYLGSGEPLYRGIAGTMVSWKGLSVNLSFAYHWGGKVYNQTLLDKVEVSTYTIASQNVDSRVLSQRWIKEGDLTFFKGFSNQATRATSRYVMDDNVFELQSLDIQYRWDSAAFQKATRFSYLIFGINMSDLLYISSVKRERGTGYPYARGIRGTLSFAF